ncbi:hemolysin family protein [Peptoniphilus catoniae]|uniref:hemolysin family protein n=1 Tax=Peptoniphilus catoniae TaxID=1660341 RepID=UPI0010FD10D1|nr:hemolysin family protein [Peptoniphilus catoniae]
MDGDGWLQILTLFLLLLGASYCASAEIAYASINKIKLTKRVEEKDPRAIRAEYITENFDKALTTLLIGNNITHIGFASLVTAMTTSQFGIKYVKYATIISTLVVFLFSEMIPKSFGKSNLKYALSISGSLEFMMKVFKPLNYFFMLISNFLSKLFPESDEPEINKEEFYEIMKTVGEEGILSSDKHDLVLSALNFDEKSVKKAYQPIEKVIALDINSNKEEIISTVKHSRYSRFPVYNKDIDNIVGILQKKEFYREYVKSGDFEITDLLIDPYFVDLNTKIDDLLENLSKKKNHLAIVRDKGKVIGIVTAEDILEELVGEIWDEEDIVNDEVGVKA